MYMHTEVCNELLPSTPTSPPPLYLNDFADSERFPTLVGDKTDI